MIRLTLLLCSAIYLTFLIGGRDMGQVRAGLVAQPAQAAPMMATIVPAPVIDQTPALITEEPRAVQVRAERTPQPAALDTTQLMPVVYVNATALNVRSGPSVQNEVIGRLTQGDAALVVWADDTGWSRIRIEGDGIEGYVASRLLTTTPAY